MKTNKDIVTLDTILTDSIPQEINKTKIKEIFEILQSQERPDLVNELKSFVLLKKTGENVTKLVEENSQEEPNLAKEMKNSVLPKSNGKRGLKLSERKKIEHSSINKVDELPTEILKKILEKLDIQSLFLAKQICRRWNEIIDKFEFLELASSKFLKSSFQFPSLFMFFSSAGTISCIMVAGGNNANESEVYTVEVFTGDLGTKKFTNLPAEIYASTMFLHDGNFLVCGGNKNKKKCLVLSHGTWKEHSSLNKKRLWHSSVTTQIATFVFGGIRSETTYEYLPKGSTTWLMGKTEIPRDFVGGCAIAVKSEQEIWLIGGMGIQKKILSFNVTDHSFQELSSQLNQGMYGPSSAFIPKATKVMITGGGIENSNFTEILDIRNGNVTMASPMNSKRLFHGIGVLTINGEDRLAVFGGDDDNDGRHDDVETYNCQTGKWETSDIRLNTPKQNFGFLTVKLSKIISYLQCTEDIALDSISDYSDAESDLDF